MRAPFARRLLRNAFARHLTVSATGSPLPGERGATRRGFTLVEVLLALALTMLVLAATYSALTLFQRVTLSGRADAERSQLARAIERRMTSDIRCVLFYEQEQETQEETDEPAAGLATVDENVGAADDPGGTTDGTGGGSTAGSSAGGSSSSSSTSSSSTSSSSSSSETTTPATPADAYATQSVGVFGDATTLVLHVSKPMRTLVTPLPSTAMPLPGAAPTAVPRTSDLRSISYFLAVAGGGGLQGAVGNTATGGTAIFATEQGNQGLTRLDGDRLAIQQADQAGGVDLLAQNATILAPEVTELTFRYFDGVAWVATWDSVALNALPRAIEVTIRIDVDADEPQQVSALAPPPPPSASDLFRFVVALPLADPTQGLAL
ncbi:MAG: prepilin-type N-terminal cleavage/methylation domain-containing protein [Planctomycetaceae bacterium]